jgi:uncharacterized membrane protein YgdD (TMEM256/DUF423 family)
MSIAKLFIALGSLNALLAVMLGAFGAHSLKSRLTENMLAAYQTGVQYHIYHALGLILVGIIIIQTLPSSIFKWSGWLMLTGIILFSGSLYFLSVTNIRWLGAITPIGGIAFIIAWLTLFVGIIRS